MNQGTLYIVATPIGNLEDITFRAVSTLKEKTDYVYCEDTRQTRKLLNHYGIIAETRSLHAHSSQGKIDEAIRHLIAGKSIAYLTDSGTPGISDPGDRLVSAARAAGVPVVPIPGPSALSAIASVSGSRGKQILFAGFLSKKDGKRKKELLALKASKGIIVIYESPYRIDRLLAAISETFPGAMVLIGREMTKYHEEFIHARIEDLIGAEKTFLRKGEFSLVIYNDADV